jgi:hypothetical protein
MMVHTSELQARSFAVVETGGKILLAMMGLSNPLIYMYR